MNLINKILILILLVSLGTSAYQWRTNSQLPKIEKELEVERTKNAKIEEEYESLLSDYKKSTEKVEDLEERVENIEEEAIKEINRLAQLKRTQPRSESILGDQDELEKKLNELKELEEKRLEAFEEAVNDLEEEENLGNDNANECANKIRENTKSFLMTESQLQRKIKVECY